MIDAVYTRVVVYWRCLFPLTRPVWCTSMRACVCLSLCASLSVCVSMCVFLPPLTLPQSVSLCFSLSLSLLHIDLEANVIDVTHHSSTPENN